MRDGVRPVVGAEQALLGAVLADPAGQAPVLDLVHVEDMTRPYHGQVLAVMKRLRERGVAPGPLQVHEEVKKDPDLPRSLSHDGVQIADLMEAAPRPGHARAYAAMVMGSGIRQRMALAASRMSQVAEGGDMNAALRMARQARWELDRCRARWEALPEPMRGELSGPSRDRGDYAGIAREVNGVRDEIRLLRKELHARTPHEVGERLAAIAKQVAEIATASAERHERLAQSRAAGEARPSGPDAEAAGVQALRDLAADPACLSAVRGWLRPGHFAKQEHGDLYAVMRDMHAAGRPVDPITVTWEGSHRGIQADAADMSGGTGAFAMASVREVHRHGVLAEVRQAGEAIQASAADPAASVGQVIRSAGARLSRLEPGPHWPHFQLDSRQAGAREGEVLAIRRPAAAAAREPVPEAAP
jgi:hypothetical protein